MLNYAYIKLSPDYLGGYYISYAQENAIIEGFETVADIHHHQLRILNLILSYSYLNSKLYYEGAIPFIPVNKFLAEIKLQSKSLDYIHFPFLSFVLSHFEEPESFTLWHIEESYSLLDLRIGGALRSGNQFININITVNNLLNTQYDSHLSLLQSLNVHNPGRNVSINVHIPFGIKEKS
jgi:iron complex outermembrane receptor protein